MEHQPQSIADRIAALKLNQVGQTPLSQNASKTGDTARRPPPPPPPPRPSLPERPNIPERALSANIPLAQEYAPVSNAGIGNLPEQGNAIATTGTLRPALPARTSTQSSRSPALPPRRESESPAIGARRPSDVPSGYELVRRDSNESASSVATAHSGLSRVSTATSDRMKAPAFDPNTLPALPPKRTEVEKAAAYKKYNDKTAIRRPLTTTQSSPSVPQRPLGPVPPLPSRTDERSPSLPPQRDVLPVTSPAPASPFTPLQRDTAQPPPKRSILTMGFGVGAKTTTNEAQPTPIARPVPAPPPRNGSTTPVNSNAQQPPPVPAASRPDLGALQASKPKMNGTPAALIPVSSGSCLICRDYSDPDSHAARFPRQSLPSNDIGWLAQQLTARFHSHTDKARAIFTWLHHNVAYGEF